MPSFLKICVLSAMTMSAYSCHPVLAQNSSAWKILKTNWSSGDEKNFQAFVQRLGETVETRSCRTVTQCFNSAANTYRVSDPAGLRYYADCADFPYFVRGYFAFKNGLPFSFASDMKLRNVPGNRGDLRYSAQGNEVSKKIDVVTRNGSFANAIDLFNNQIPNQTDSGNFRVNYKGNDTGALFADFYPVKLDREAIVPGTILYDPNGHVTMVYKITDDGKVYYVDAHPDNSLTTGAFSIKFVRSQPGQGAGFKNWRPVKLVGASQNAQGIWLGGRIETVPNQSLAHYGTEQFFGTEGNAADWTQARFTYKGRAVSYYEYARLKLAKGELRILPVDDFRSTLEDLCQSVQDRVLAVDVAIKAGIQNKEHPTRLPENIYGTQGEWETYSTPSRDAQLKVSFRDLLDQADGYMKKIAAKDPSVVYTGPNLPRELLDVYNAESTRCQMTYTNSAGQGVTLNLEQIRQRLFALSFDPYHCVELRWGASSWELQTCGDSQIKRLWYTREQRLRNQHIRRYDLRMDFSLDELLTPSPANGVATPFDIDIKKFLLGLGA
ncbi:MAG: hypothetical protein ACK5P7_12085 [Bdellovibrio sp.]|jgi:hypothetical protein